MTNKGLDGFLWQFISLPKIVKRLNKRFAFAKNRQCFDLTFATKDTNGIATGKTMTA